jgi:hypothetical protein
MTDVAYLCHNCGSVHEVESIRENLILDLRAAASYEMSGHRGVLNARRRFLRWRMARGLARALWPGNACQPRLLRGSCAPVPHRPVPCRAVASGSDVYAGNPALAVPAADRAGIGDSSTLLSRRTMISEPEAASAAQPGPRADGRLPRSGEDHEVIEGA